MTMSIGMDLVLRMAVLLTVTAVPGLAQERLEAPRDALRPDVLGCYALYSSSGKLLDSSFYNSSPLIELDSSVVGITARDSRPGIIRSMIRRDANGRVLTRSREWGRSWWADSLSDSIRISFSNGFSGAFVILNVPRGMPDTVWGRIEEHWDLGPTVNDRGGIRAVRIRCRAA